MPCRLAPLTLLLALTACRTLDMFGDEPGGVCDDVTTLEEGGAFACDGGGGLVACTGDRALTKAGGLNVCTRLEDAGYLLVCTKGPQASHWEVELLPCDACTLEQGPALGVVDFDVGSCRLPALPLVDPEPENVEPAVEEDEELEGQAFEPCPCRDTLRCDVELDVCVARDACAEDIVCAEGERCLLDDEGAPACMVDDTPAPADKPEIAGRTET